MNDQANRTTIIDGELHMLREEHRKMSECRRELFDRADNLQADMVRLSWRIYDLEKQQ